MQLIKEWNPHITGHLVFILVSAEGVVMCPVSDKHISCETHALIHFLHVEIISTVEI
jgi:hypothetical protein